LEHIGHEVYVLAPPASVLPAASASMAIGPNAGRVLGVDADGFGNGDAPGGPRAGEAPSDGLADGLGEADLLGRADTLAPGLTEEDGSGGKSPPSPLPAAAAPALGLTGIWPPGSRGSIWVTPTTINTTTMLAATSNAGSAAPPARRVSQKRRRRP
jgi:hypothetical protein